MLRLLVYTVTPFLGAALAVAFFRVIRNEEWNHHEKVDAPTSKDCTFDLQLISSKHICGHHVGMDMNIMKSVSSRASGLDPNPITFPLKDHISFDLC